MVAMLPALPTEGAAPMARLDWRHLPARRGDRLLELIGPGRRGNRGDALSVLIRAPWSVLSEPNALTNRPTSGRFGATRQLLNCTVGSAAGSLTSSWRTTATEIFCGWMLNAPSATRKSCGLLTRSSTDFAPTRDWPVDVHRLRHAGGALKAARSAPTASEPLDPKSAAMVAGSLVASVCANKFACSRRRSSRCCSGP